MHVEGVSAAMLHQSGSAGKSRRTRVAMTLLPHSWPLEDNFDAPQECRLLMKVCSCCDVKEGFASTLFYEQS